MTIDKEEVIGKLIHYGTIFGCLILIGISLLTMFSSGIYGYIYLPNNKSAIIHAISLLSLSSSFLAYYLILGFMFPLARSIVCLAISILNIQLYDFMWSIFSQASRGSGFSFGALISVIVLIALLQQFHNKHGVFRFANTWTPRRIAFMILIATFVLSFKGLIDTNFFNAMSLYDAGLGPDPNVGNIYWLFGKVIVFWILLPTIDRADYKVPLRLDPRVLVW